MPKRRFDVAYCCDEVKKFILSDLFGYAKLKELDGEYLTSEDIRAYGLACGIEVVPKKIVREAIARRIQSQSKKE